jgi:hypothetical protein
MYAGLAVVLVASVALYLLQKQPQSNGRQSIGLWETRLTKRCNSQNKQAETLMEPPEKVRVCYEEPDYGHQGRLSDGRQFIAFTTGSAPLGQHWVDRVVAVLHLFDPDGNHLGTESRLGGYCQNHDTYREDDDRATATAWAALDELLARLAPFPPERCPVDVRLFGLVINGVEYGFFFRPVVDDESEEEWVIHMPRDHWYYPPWDTGEYDT